MSWLYEKNIIKRLQRVKKYLEKKSNSNQYVPGLLGVEFEREAASLPGILVLDKMRYKN